MADYDIFNGDADGICALLQLRLAEPRNATLITGVKRDISLLKQVNAKPGDRLTVLDISMEKIPKRFMHHSKQMQRYNTLITTSPVTYLNQIV